MGTANEITTDDDLAYNPDKISATLKTLHVSGCLLLMFSTLRYGPICLTKDALADCFVSELRDEDVLIMLERISALLIMHWKSRSHM